MVQKVCGVDVGKSELVFTITGNGKPKRLVNSKSGVQGLVRKLITEQVNLVVVEATGGYERLLVTELWQANLKVAVVNPRHSWAFARSIGQAAKTDSVDAVLLARMGESIELRCTEAPSAQTLTIRAHLMRRGQLMQMIAMERCHLKAPLMLESEKAFLREHILCLKREVKKLDRQIAGIVASVPEMQSTLELLTAVPGVGKFVAFQLIANLPELGRLSRRKIAALVGVAPYNRDSGHMSGQRHIFGGRAEVRTALYMATVTAVRCDATLKAFFISLKKRGKHSLVALVAAMRKLLLTLNALRRAHLAAQNQRSLPKLVTA